MGLLLFQPVENHKRQLWNRYCKLPCQVWFVRYACLLVSILFLLHMQDIREDPRAHGRFSGAATAEDVPSTCCWWISRVSFDGGMYNAGSLWNADWKQFGLVQGLRIENSSSCNDASCFLRLFRLSDCETTMHASCYVWILESLPSPCDTLCMKYYCCQMDTSSY